ncbi:major paralogous domain-containing protein [Fibrobacter sp. UWCM]|uniref:FISUMP domain-containing protein n=1 Tax=Fibrobacter sp. UWCM TaxID=1896208 RepID=UPI00090F8C0C|nr:FISUMP domain-containing protein [Fibrobacter sp. UWCM]SHH45050.1 major paralogous domain-containing protein [Fibrobacter sp. UWCM]
MRSILLIICFVLFLVACGDGGTSEPILHPVGKSESSSSSFDKVSSSETTSQENQPSSAESDTSSEEFCVENECFVIDKRDGNVYRVIEIGEQLWMAQDLMYEIVNQQCFDESVNDCAKYDGLYSWSAAMDSAGNFSLNGLGCGDGLVCVPASPVRGICPAGWHLPNNNEIKNMIYAMMHNSDLDLFGRSTFWLSTEENDQDAFYMGLNMTEEHKSMMASPKSDLKKTLLNVRCLKGKSSDGAAVVSSSSSVSVNSSSSSVGLYISYGEMTDERDGHVYKTMTISGTLYDKFYPKQIWMAENLNYAYLQPTSTEDSSSWCGDNDPETCKRYGRLYLWSAAIDSAAVFSEDAKGCGYFATDDKWVKCTSERNIRGICPEEWRLPTYNEYYKLLFWRLRDGSGFAKEQLLEYFEDEKEEIWGSSNFWLATEKSNTMAFRDAFSPYSLEYSEGYPLSGALSPEDKSMVHSVRCVKDVLDIE